MSVSSSSSRSCAPPESVSELLSAPFASFDVSDGEEGLLPLEPSGDAVEGLAGADAAGAGGLAF